MPWNGVAAVAEIAERTGLTHVGFVVGRPAAVAPPPHAPIDDELAAIPAKLGTGDSAVAIAKLWQREIDGCSALAKAWTTLANDGGGDLGTRLIERTEPALLDCDCSVNMPNVRTMMWQMMSTAQPMAPIDVELVRDGVDIEAAPATAWSAVQDKLASGANLARRRAAVSDAPEARDAIVVLGARLGARGQLTDVLRERVAVAATLFAAGGAPRIVATGGVTRAGAPAEGDAIAAALRAAGVPDAAIVVERAARSTAENARMTAPLLPPRARVWLVTQPFHARRAVYVFRRAGFDAKAWPMPDSLEYRQPRRARKWRMREWAAWLRVLLG